MKTKINELVEIHNLNNNDLVVGVSFSKTEAYETRETLARRVRMESVYALSGYEDENGDWISHQPLYVVRKKR